MGHVVKYEDSFTCFKYLYENLPASNFDSISNPVRPPDINDMSWRSNGMLIEFNQKNFVDNENDWQQANLAEKGYLYYPKKCINETQCHLQVHLHGCY